MNNLISTSRRFSLSAAQKGWSSSLFIFFLLAFPAAFFTPPVSAEEHGFHWGPVWDSSPLTLEDGQRNEAVGPFFYLESQPNQSTWAIPPVMSSLNAPDTDSQEFDLLYPILTYDRYGSEYKFQIIQLLSFSGGELQSGETKDRFTLFPFYFQQRTEATNESYWALFPIYGKLRNRLFRAEIDFALWPLYVKTKRKPGAGSVGADEFLSIGNRWAQSRRGDVTTYNYLAPIFHLRYGDGLRGWQVWPLAGHERKQVTSRTNSWGDVESVPGHEKTFVLWPIWTSGTRDIGTTNTSRYSALLPFYASLRSPPRDSTSYLWPFGLTLTDDRAKGYNEVDLLWPVFAYARGEGKTTTRFWPVFGVSHNNVMERNFYLWPVYRYSRIHSDPLDRHRTQILFFLYSDKKELNTATDKESRRIDLWPLFTHRRYRDGSTKLQVFSPVEPILSASKSVERNYSQLWSIWRYEKTASTGATSHSLLWNLYSNRRSADGVRKTSLLFGFFQSKATPEGNGFSMFFIPLKRAPEPKQCGAVASESIMHQPVAGAQP